jgi:H/ACA ribonucleoprotein complex subunit 3
MDVYIDDPSGKGLKKVPLPSKTLGVGGEATVYPVGPWAFKVYNPPNHPNYFNKPNEQEMARRRLREQPQKLASFPHLPNKVVQPQFMVYNKKGDVIGYAMRLIENVEPLYKYSEVDFRQGGALSAHVNEIFKDLHPTVRDVHKTAIIGDFNDLNVLVRTNPFEALIIDSDSFDFGPFRTRMYTPKFLDPLLADLNTPTISLGMPYTEDSDWYAFAVMLLQCLLLTDPYNGVYRSKDPTKRVEHVERWKHRITIFHPDVKVPKKSISYKVLPDDLLHYFHEVFHKDRRGEFPFKLLEDSKWVVCASCGTEHAKSYCPVCSVPKPVEKKETVTVRGSVIATEVFSTRGVILFAASQGGLLKYLYYENGEFRREDHTRILRGGLDPSVRYRICGDKTLLGKNGLLITLTKDGKSDRIGVDQFGSLPIFDANENVKSWLENGRLYCDGQLSPKFIGDVISDQTLIWTGQSLGFGFSRAGDLNIYFIFQVGHQGIKEIKIPPIQGHLKDSTCFFGDNHVWFFVSCREGNRVVNRCTAYNTKTDEIWTAEAEEDDHSWLGQIRGKCAVGNYLLAATDTGLVRLELNNGSINVKTTYPDTEPFIQAGSHLFPGNKGIYVVEGKQIRILRMQ